MPDTLGPLGPVAAAVFGYFLGSIPFGLLLTRLSGLGDIRVIGSGNIGATNVLRTGRKGLALLTLLLDGGKGAIAVLLMTQYGEIAMLVAGAGAVIGHSFPIWLRLKGGKSVATGLGVLLGAAPLAGLLACATWLAVAVLTRFSSLAAIAAFALAPIYCLLLFDWPRVAMAALIAALIIWRHRGNIERLRAGTEPRIGAS